MGNFQLKWDQFVDVFIAQGAYEKVLEGLKNIDSEEIFIEFTTNINPCIIRPADDVKYTYLLLPVRISSNI